MIELTDYTTGCKTIFHPELFILHKPQVVQIDVGKPTFHQTALMSVQSPEMITMVREGYQDVRALIHLECHSTIELTHNMTGTKFYFCPKYFQFIDAHDDITHPVMVSLWNPLVTVPIKETWKELREKLDEVGCNIK